MSNPLRKTMVYLGLADDDQEYDHSPVPTAPAASNAGQRAPVTPLRRPSTSRVSAHAELSEILTVHPRAFKEAQGIAESFREGVPVIMNLSQMSDPEARRLVDFASGLAEGLHGRIERVTARVFLLSPAHVATTGEGPESEPDVDASFLARD